jgi:hypothetical protein
LTVAALGLCIALFLFWQLLGYAVLWALRSRRNLLQNLLLAPAVGVASTLLPLLWLSRLGLPVRHFGLLLGLALLILAVCLLRRSRAVVPLRRFIPFVGVFLLALFLTGRPMLEFGFAWVSYANDDMINYVLSAQRFLEHGFLDMPDAEAIQGNRDMTLVFWLAHVIAGVRAGSELLLAWAMSLSGLNGPQTFMPVILALYLALVSVSGALVCTSGSRRTAALLTCLATACSALTTMGTLYQLIGQVFGLVLLSAAAVLLLRLRFPAGRSALWREALTAALVLAGLIFAYPETLPFLGLAFTLLLLVGACRRTLPLGRALQFFGATGLGTALLVNQPGILTLDFLASQASVGTQGADLNYPLFPYFLVPAGLANLWGFLPVASSVPEPWLSLAILAGALLLLAATVAAGWYAWQAEPVALVGCSFLTFVPYSFLSHLDFALFKLAMYGQPFLLGVLVLACGGLTSRLRHAK